MKFEVVNSFKSIPAGVTWDDVPMFAIVTGENGVGKTQLLELMASAVHPQTHGSPPPRSCFSEIIDPDRLVHVRITQTLLKGGQHSALHLQSELSNLFGSGNNPRYTTVANKRSIFDKLSEETGKPHKELNVTDLMESSMWWAVAQESFDPEKVFQSLGAKFHRYFLKHLDIAIKHQDFAAANRELNTAPWDEFNQLLAEVGFPYKVTAPTSVAQTYTLQCQRPGGNERIPLEYLSSGETALLMVLAWVYGGQLTEVFPQLILLDEPDATLHSALIPDFLRHLQETVVENFGCRVIITTHRLETIAAAPAGTLYELRKNPHRIEAVDSHDQVAARMTGGVFEMIMATRCVFVEDEDDAHFYREMYQVLRRDKILPATPSLSFSPASIGKGNSREAPGGRSSVRTHVRRLREAGLGQFVRGLIDRDNQPDDTDGMIQLERYAIENYLYDPLVLFCASIDADQAPPINGLDAFHPGDEPRLRTLPDESLQRIADGMIALLEKELGINGKEKRTEHFINDRTVQYPEWLWTTRGHDLEGPAHRAFPWLRHVRGQPGLRKAILRLGMFQESLVRVFQQLQSLA